MPAQAAPNGTRPPRSSFAEPAPCATMTAVQPTSCSRLSAAKKPPPARPNDVFAQSIPPRRVRAPRSIARKSITPPNRCPSRIAPSTDQPRPPTAAGASAAPASISAIETAAPNHTSPHPRTDIPFLSSFMFPFPTPA